MVQVNREHKPLQGIEAGRDGFTVRGVVPITGTDGSHLGSLEVMSGFTPLLNKLKSTSKEELAVYMDKKLLSTTTKLQDPGKYPILNDKFVFVAATNAKLAQQSATTDFLTKGQQGKTM